MSSSPSRHAPRLPLWKRLLYSVVVAVTLLGVPEAILRWTDAGRALFPAAYRDEYAGGAGHLRFLTSDPVLFWRGRPFARVTGDEFLNDRGFRGNSFRNEKPPAMQRVVCMGDSSTFGMVSHGGIVFTYSPTYSSELQSLLNRGKSEQAVQVINAGIIGYSTLHGLQLLKHDVRHWQPDVITIRFGTNDHLRRDPHYVPASEPRSFVVRSLQDTLLGTQSYQLLIRLRISALRTAALNAPEAAAGAAPPPPQPVEVRVPLPEFEYNMRRLVIEGRATGAQVVLITTPTAPASAQISTDRARLWVMGYTSYEDLTAEHELYNEAVRRVAKDLDVDLLDSSRHLEARGLEKFFTKYDFAHPNGDGHVAIAQGLAALIESEGLLSK